MILAFTLTKKGRGFMNTQIEPCGHNCFECPWPDCIMPTGAGKIKKPAIPSEIKLNTYPAKDWKNHPIYGRAGK